MAMLIIIKKMQQVFKTCSGKVLKTEERWKFEYSFTNVLNNKKIIGSDATFCKCLTVDPNL